MKVTIYVRMKRLGRQRSRQLQVVPFALDHKPKTLQELLIALTELGVKDYNARKEEGQLLPFLTREQMADQAARGKISFGVYNGEKADLNKAIENTVQSFEDGIYRVFAGEEELKNLSDEIPWKEDLVFTFVRLTMLSG